MSNIQHSIHFIDRPQLRLVRVNGQWMVERRSPHWQATDWQRVSEMMETSDEAERQVGKGLFD